MVQIRKLSDDRWKDFRDLRLKALKTDPAAYGGSYEEAVKLKEEDWRRRIKSTVFAMSGDEPIGMIVPFFDQNPKTRHIVEIYGFYVSPEHRGEGVGKKLMERALALARRNPRIVKVSLAVNPEQRAAVKIYRNAGFVVTGRAEKELRVGGKFYAMIFMEKVLRPE